MSSDAVPVCRRGAVLRCGAQGILPTNPDCQQTSRALEVLQGHIPFVSTLTIMTFESKSKAVKPRSSQKNKAESPEKVSRFAVGYTVLYTQ